MHVLRVFQTTFNLCRLSVTLIRLKFSKKIDAKLANDLVNDVLRCGSVTIKFGQWFATKHDISSFEINPLYAELRRTLENCPEHDLNHTKRVFKESFGKDLESVIELCEGPIASGSVGQVYRGFMKREVNEVNEVNEKGVNEKGVTHGNEERERSDRRAGTTEAEAEDREQSDRRVTGTGTTAGRMVVMKVMHPNLAVDYYISSIYLKLLGLFIPTVEVDEFLRNVKAQYNYENEAKNLKMMYDFYKDDKVIIIPELILNSDQVLIMSYEDGVDYGEIHKDVLKRKIALSIMAFQRQNASVLGYIHGDLHYGNWKVRVGDNGFKLVIYDFGLVNKVDTGVMERWMKAYQYQDFDTLVDLALMHSHGVRDQSVRGIILQHCKNVIHPKAGMMNTLKVIIPMMKRYKIKMRDNFMFIIISFALTENVLSHLDRGTICIDTQNAYISNCLDIIAFCESRGTCDLLKKQLEDDIHNIKLTRLFVRSENAFDDCSLDDFYAEGEA